MHKSFFKIYSVAIVTLFLFSSSCKVHDLDFKGVEDYSVGSLQSENIELTVKVKLDNPNSFKIKVIKADLNLFIGGNEAGKAKLKDKVIIKNKKEDVYDITIVTNKKQLMSAAFKAAIPSLASGKVEVKVAGKIKGRVFCFGKKIPVEFKEKVDTNIFKKF